MSDKPTRLRQHVKAADLILTTAASVDLPEPFTAAVTGGGITLQFHTLAELTEWSIWADEPIEEWHRGYDERRGVRIHYRVQAVLLDQPLVLSTVVYPDEATDLRGALAMVGGGS